MKNLVGFYNTISSSGNKGVLISTLGDYSQWETQNKECHGQRAEVAYVSGEHLKDEDLGKEIITYYKKDKDGNPYCSGFKLM